MGQMNSKEWVKQNEILVVIIIVTFFTLAFLGFFFLRGDYGHYDRDIERNIDGDEEKQVLESVENFSYGEVFDMERFANGGGEAWANFIDSDVINHYNTEYERLRDQKARHNIHLMYKAKVYKIDDLNIIYTYTPETVLREYPNGDVEVTGDEYVLELYNNSEILVTIDEDFFPDIIAVFAGTNHSYYDQESIFQINFSNVYLVHQYLHYSDAWGPLAGYGVRIHQIVIMDEKCQPLFVFIDNNQYIS